MFEYNTQAPEEFTPFRDDTDRLVKYKEWGLISCKEKKPREFLFYQGDATQGEPFICKVAGYTKDKRVVVEFPGRYYHLLCPHSLREMQGM
ncbi:hypothetical protein AM501_09900 [Aneurinibacillus migulanus]|uniref:hypothetical protein n=1 Tax=Aneurinibacillus migulanus TaxID=47500 RepID=UPI0005BDD024|nr:hypothetical protein [Aneurinibacillus migulanus]KIV56457.1 hypothetical protein TS64_09315 [Aneurinibacillus migulanus]KPD08465.1 hypothetical protein AM501_09900 [Aneurinibacillus migulanus]